MGARCVHVVCCFSFQFYIKPQHELRQFIARYRCFSFQFYIKPQLNFIKMELNHRCFSFQFYIKPQHYSHFQCAAQRCFSFQFYIKPQPPQLPFCFFPVVSHSNSTSNHNYDECSIRGARVVSHSNSTSNHNSARHHMYPYRLFLIPILHQTTTIQDGIRDLPQLFLIPILHQTTTSRMAVIHILHVTHMTPMHKTSCRTPGKLVGCNFVFQRAIYQKNSSC